MPRTSDKRERLLRSADQLILRQGFRQTTLSDIADESGVPLGNVYYYFKTKEDIGVSVIEARLASLQALLNECDRHSDPKERLLAFLEYPVEKRESLAESGCPLGTLSYELSHSDTFLGEASSRLVKTVLAWSHAQFEQLGNRDAHALALQFVSNLQGMSLIANTLGEPTVVTTMVSRTRAWLETV